MRKLIIIIAVAFMSLSSATAQRYKISQYMFEGDKDLKTEYSGGFITFTNTYIRTYFIEVIGGFDITSKSSPVWVTVKGVLCKKITTYAKNGNGDIIIFDLYESNVITFCIMKNITQKVEVMLILK